MKAVPSSRHGLGLADGGQLALDRMRTLRVRLAITVVATVALIAAQQAMAPNEPAVTVPGVLLALAIDIHLAMNLRRRERPAERPLNDSTREFLAAVERKLILPQEIRAEIRAELADHLADTVAALEVEGSTQEKAIATALARLGQPEDLARQLTAAHRTTKRMLAGAAGGVWVAGWRAIEGLLAFAGLALLILMTGAAIDGKFFPVVYDYWAGFGFLGPAGFSDFEAPLTATALICVLALAPAFAAGRMGARAAARISRRSPGLVGLAWAIIGAAALLWFVLFWLRVAQSWVVVWLEMAIPVAFAIGALTSSVDHVPLPRPWGRGLLWYVGLGLACAVVAGAAATWPPANTGRDYRLPNQSQSLENALGYDRVAPMGTFQTCDPTDVTQGMLLWNGTCSPLVGLDSAYDSPDGPPYVYHDRVLLSSPSALSGFSDLRLEIWRAVLLDGDNAVDPAESAPYVVAPARVVGRDLEAYVDLSHVRTNRWLVFPTGVGSDGKRYPLGWQWGIGTTFSGAVWDWLAAPD